MTVPVPDSFYIGKQYGRITVLSVSGYGKPGGRVATGECSCGNPWSGSLYALKYGKTRSCGCFRLARIKEANTRHGLEGSPEYRAWVSMKRRVLDATHPAYHNYGGRGITVHEPWINDFGAFIKHVGLRPSKDHSLERKDNDAGYVPGNLRWATRVEQGNNRRTNRIIEHAGRKQTVSEWARELGVSKGLLKNRLDAGWSDERTITTAVAYRTPRV